MDAPTTTPPPAPAAPEASNDEATARDTTDQPSQPTTQADVPKSQAESKRSKSKSTIPQIHDLAAENPELSKNQLKKLRKSFIVEEKRKYRKSTRKEKRHEKAAAKLVEREAVIAEATAAGRNPEQALKKHFGKERIKQQLVPLTLILDCDFEKYMSDKELISLTGQVTRSYAENRNRKYKAHMFISSFKGTLKKRFETVLDSTYKSWKHCYVEEGDFLDAAARATHAMEALRGGELAGAFRNEPTPVISSQSRSTSSPEAEAEVVTGDKSVVYLTSDSPNTLDKLEPFTSYVIGGIVDKNREKGLCYKIARKKGVRTAKLPIGDYMVMASRQVLTTNQVVEIMLNWLELGDWGEAFMKVIPKRKGGRLKGGMEAGADDGEERLEDAEDDEENRDGRVGVDGDMDDAEQDYEDDEEQHEEAAVDYAARFNLVIPATPPESATKKKDSAVTREDP